MIEDKYTRLVVQLQNTGSLTHAQTLELIDELRTMWVCINAEAPKGLDALSVVRKMVVDAHDACKSEAMCCPWCSGYLSHDREEHDEFCLWTKLHLDQMGQVT